MDAFRYWTRWLRPSWHRQAKAAEALAAVYAKGLAAHGEAYDKDDDPAAQAVKARYVAAEQARGGMPDERAG